MRYELNKARREIKKEYKRQRRKRRTFFIILFIIFIIYIIAFPLLAKIFMEYEPLYSSLIFFYIYINIIIAYYYFFYIYKKILYSTGGSDQFLSSWIENIGKKDPIITSISTQESKQLSIDNLLLLKENIINYCDDNEEKLRLLRSYYYTLLNNNKQAAWQSIAGFSVALIGFLIRGVINGELTLKIMGASFTPFSVFIGLITLLIFIHHDLTTKRNKELIIYKIIDELIELKDEQHQNNTIKVRDNK